jgi:DNA-directed RNA polymerase specialized sigma24 family protein
MKTRFLAMESTPSSHHGKFPETNWTRIVEAGKSGDGVTASTALALLCDDYWRPVYGFLRRQGYSPHDSEDLTQGFFAMLLSGGFLQNASADIGRFRNYLLGALRNYLSGERRKANTEKRGSGQRPFSLDFSGAENYLGSLGIDHVSPDLLFDKLWALRLLENVLSRLEKRYLDAGGGKFFNAMKNRLSFVGDDRSHAEVAAELGIDEGTLNVAFHRMKKRYRAILLAEVRRTLANEEDAEAELLHLIAPFSGR